MADLSDIVLLENIEALERAPYAISANRDCDLDMLTNEDFRVRYRLHKQTAELLLGRIEHKLQTSRINNYITPGQKLCIALRYYSSGSFQQVVGDLSEVSQPSSCRVINEVSRCVAELRPEFVTLPETEMERREVSKKFYAIDGFPGVLGAVDCTHIKIKNPGGPMAENFRCRKGYFSLNVQALCDAELMIRHIVACWPGRTHDMVIFENSELRAVLQTSVPHSYHLLGDKGYACRSYLLTPFWEPASAIERRYNTAHSRTRCSVERTFGVWKRRFPCIHMGLRCDLNNSLPIIVATAVLHNIAIANGDYFEDDEIDPPDDENFLLPLQADNVAGTAKRLSIANNYFSTRRNI